MFWLSLIPPILPEWLRKCRLPRNTPSSSLIFNLFKWKAVQTSELSRCEDMVGWLTGVRPTPPTSGAYREITIRRSILSHVSTVPFTKVQFKQQKDGMATYKCNSTGSVPKNEDKWSMGRIKWFDRFLTNEIKAQNRFLSRRRCKYRFLRSNSKLWGTMGQNPPIVEQLIPEYLDLKMHQIGWKCSVSQSIANFRA